MSQPEFVVAYVTTPDQDTATRIGRVLVEERLVACANASAPVTSVYRWQGVVTTDSEFALLLKTRRELCEAVRRRVVELHPYDCPGVVFWDLIDGNPAYLAWLREQTTLAPVPSP